MKIRISLKSWLICGLVTAFVGLIILSQIVPGNIGQFLGSIGLYCFGILIIIVLA